MTNFAEKFEIVRKYQEDIPVKLISLANDLGLKVYLANDWDEDISGKIIHDSLNGGTSGYAIYINAKHGENRRRFTIAHEISHFILHKKLIGDGIFDDGLYRSNLQHYVETEANQFAARILMPEKKVKDAIQSGMTRIGELADHFKVSLESISYRIENMGLKNQIEME